ncbi:hypothetical protein [Paenibacillus graminis]|uniref:hypothetical protein n=1 Tax=Paenibacillus graminis TaxID=189425 RepID=UPI0012DE15AB|nr:hypothetical protein [Paenibacillus graminis]
MYKISLADQSGFLNNLTLGIALPNPAATITAIAAGMMTMTGPGLLAAELPSTAPFIVQFGVMQKYKQSPEGKGATLLVQVIAIMMFVRCSFWPHLPVAGRCSSIPFSSRAPTRYFKIYWDSTACTS